MSRAYAWKGETPIDVPEDGVVRSPIFRVWVGGDLACFTDPVKKDERNSYMVMTPSAGRGLNEAIMRKQSVDHVTQRIYVLQPPEFFTFKTNEVKRGARSGESIFVEDDRDQRYTRALRRVEYVIEGYFRMTKDARPQDHPIKYVTMFERRVKSGQRWHQPYLGCRDFPAWFKPPPEKIEPHPSLVGKTIDLGQMLLGLDYDVTPAKAFFFHAELRDGILVEAGKNRIPELKVKGF